MRKLMVLAAILTLLTATAGVTLAQTTAEQTPPPDGAMVGYFVHGIPDTAVDVYVDDQLVLEKVEPGSVQGPFSGMMAESETGVLIALVPAGEDASAALVRLVLRTPPGNTIAILAHPNAQGVPVLSVLPLNVEATTQSRLLLYHLAAAPALDLRLARDDQAEQVLGTIAPNSVFQTEIEPGTVNGYLAASGTTDSLFGPFVSDVMPGAIYIGYAVGSVEDETFNVIVHTIEPNGKEDAAS